MRIKSLVVTILVLAGMSLQAQSVYNEKGQAVPPPTQPFGAEAFEPTQHTVIRWLGSAGFLVNSRGTCLMVDPMLKGFDMSVLIDSPIQPEDVPHLDAVLVTHPERIHVLAPGEPFTLRRAASSPKADESLVFSRGKEVKSEHYTERIFITPGRSGTFIHNRPDGQGTYPMAGSGDGRRVSFVKQRRTI